VAGEVEINLAIHAGAKHILAGDAPLSEMMCHSGQHSARESRHTKRECGVGLNYLKLSGNMRAVPGFLSPLETCGLSPVSNNPGFHPVSNRHPIIASFEPGEDWFYHYEKRGTIKGVELLPPHSHPEDQPSPGPARRVPANWESLLHELASTDLS
jgi:hypothetical protein